MKISASIYSDKSRSLEAVVKDLQAHQVDLLHVDCNDDLSVFEDIKAIRTWCSIPIDLHIITEQPEKYYNYLRETPVEYVTFQFEDLKQSLVIPADVPGKKGLAIITPTSIDAFEAFEHYDFILIMATIPGQSGGKFDAVNFNKIRQFRKKYPNKSIHVDGGVNGEVSFIIRNMGVSVAVSGSYLFKAPSIGHALMDLTKRDMESHYMVKDFMTPVEESPTVKENELSIASVLTSIEKGGLGFCLIVGDDNQFKGLISNADVRKGLLNCIDDLNQIDVKNLINSNPVFIGANSTVNELLQVIKQCSFPILYLPVLEKERKLTGIVNFVNLIKGEL